ncbi:MAG: replicative DNA helicase [Saprospiraceae bacterium]|nr:replicative DNA helicase [Saprospiraceae bacterium]MCB0675405.1 replicative DNA helicase [Saprospiraceae bacterium]
MAEKSRNNKSKELQTRTGSELSNFVFGKVQPQARELEEAVLGALMLDKDALAIVLDILRPDSFYLEGHQHIFEAMLRLFQRSQPIDLLTVTEELKKAGDLEAVGGPYYLVELSNKVASAANIEYHARIIAQKHIQRELIRVSTQIIRDAYEDTTDVFNLLDDAEKGLFNITQQNLSRGVENMGALATKALKQLEELKDREDGLTGIPTGFTALDRLTSGWQASDLVIIAARPGMGKTSFVLALTRNAAVDFKKPVAIFSLEMSNIQLVQRLISLEAEISGSKLRNGQLEEYEWQQLHTSIEHLSEAPIFIDDTPGINIFELRAKCRRLKMQHDIQLVIIDYLQLMSGGADNQRGNREQEVSAISRALKGMAKELNVPVIALSQLSRAVEVRGGSKRPQLSDLRESGCLTGDTLLQDAVTGRLVTIKELAERTEQSAMQVVALDEQLKLGGHQMTKAFYSGQKQVFELETRTGRKIKASANHPFLKLRGWTPLEELQLGDRIAVPRKIRIEKPDNPLSGEELILLAHLIGDGCILPNQPYHYTSADPANIEVVSQSARILFGIESAILESPLPETLSQSDILWDEIVSITPLGIEDVYDATVPGVHNFVANDIIVHNSIEQDSDIVSFIYRPEYYQILEDEEGQSLKGIAEIIIAKNRHGALDTIKLRFVDQFAKFADLDESDFDALPDDTFSSPFDGGNIITRPSRMNDDEDIPF